MTEKILHHIEKLLVIHAPVQCVYNQCSQFKEFSRFAPYVMSIRQYDDFPIRMQIGFREKRFKCQTEKYQSWGDDPVASWSPSCRVHQGSITLECEDGQSTRVTVELDCAPSSPLGRTEGSPGAVEAQIEAVLQRFRHFIEPASPLAPACADRQLTDELPVLSSETPVWTRY